jgi:hypothetical protein
LVVTILPLAVCRLPPRYAYLILLDYYDTRAASFPPSAPPSARSRRFAVEDFHAPAADIIFEMHYAALTPRSAPAAAARFTPMADDYCPCRPICHAAAAAAARRRLHDDTFSRRRYFIIEFAHYRRH